MDTTQIKRPPADTAGGAWWPEAWRALSTHGGGWS
jgi:hypothetical protein